MSRPQPEPLARDRIMEVACGVARAAGLDDRDPRLITFTNNAVVRLPAAGAVVRIAGSATPRARIPGVIAAAGWFARHGIPAIRLWPGLDQPVPAAGHLATVWVDAADGGTAPVVGELAAILRAIHAVTDPAPPGIPTWAPTAGIRGRLAEAATLPSGVLDPEVLDYLTTETGAVEADLAGLARVPPLLPAGVIHGDAHLGNLIGSRAGAVICDFDSTRVGPREWDLAPAAAGALRFRGASAADRDLGAAYGVDVTTWPGFPALRRLRDLQLITSVVPVLSANPALRGEWEHRLASYRAGDDTARWTPYADLN